MSRYSFKLPDVGEGIAQAEIIAWHVKPGDQIAEDAPLIDVMTDKATVEITSPVSGRVVSVDGEVGDQATVGSVVAVLEVAGVGDAQRAPPHPVAAPAPLAVEEAVQPQAKPAKVEVQRIEPRIAPRASDRPLASPAVRKRALDLGVDLTRVRGSGPSGRIVHADLDAPQAPQAGMARARRDGIEDIKVIGLRRRIAEKMSESKRRIPHFSYVEEVDVTELERLRSQLNGLNPQRGRLTLLPFIIRALADVLPAFPQMNAVFDDEASVVHRHGGVHVGIATQTPGGLSVPVLRHAETLDLWEAAAEVARLAEVARTGKATREELSGSTITITSLGPLGGVSHTPVINHPEVAIVGPNKIVERPVVVDGAVVVRKMMNLSSSFDHRVIDGWDAAQFIQRLKLLLETPALLFVDLP